MFLPVGDIIPSRTTPWATYSIIGLTTIVFLREVTLRGAESFDRFVFVYGLAPSAFSWTAAVTSLFVHAGWVHAIGNLLTLWIFGGNVEDRMGHGRFLVFYLLAGLAGALAEAAAHAASATPIVGSGAAVAGVMGAYFVMFPKSRVLVLIYLFVFVDVIEIPAFFFLAFWLFVQLLSGVGQLGTIRLDAGLALWSHAAGFVGGALMVWVFRRPERRRVEWWS